MIFYGCEKGGENINYKQEMREFVEGISEYSKNLHPGFLVIPQNGIELVTLNGSEDAPPELAYLAAIDGNGQEDLVYGYSQDDRATSDKDRTYLNALLNISKNSGNVILVTDYCSTPAKMDDSYHQNHQSGYISFAADHRELDHIPDYPNPIYALNFEMVTSLSQVQNFLYLINPGKFTSKTEFISEVISTNYDMIIMDLFFDNEVFFTATEIQQLRQKASGGTRLVLAYMSIGEAEDYRYYWQENWSVNKPSWMDKENRDWEGNYKVKYWDAAWQDIIFGNDDSYVKKILDADFDGVYLDIIDAFEYYE
jgi:cysteinyl-tRNA synthetase